MDEAYLSHIFLSSTKWESIKQCVEPDSSKALKITVFGKSGVLMDRKRASGSKGAEALRQTTSIAWSRSAQPEVRAGSKRLVHIFSRFQRVCFWTASRVYPVWLFL